MRSVALALAAMLGGCTMASHGTVTAARSGLVPAQWPSGPAYALASDAALPRYDYRMVLGDPRLLALIERALGHNQDLAQALANIDAARAQFAGQRAALLPELDSNAGFTRAGGPGTAVGGASARKGDSYLADLSASWELDLFGRVRSLAEGARQSYLASAAGGRAVRLTLVANVANAWLAYAADASLLKLAQDTAVSAREAVNLTQKRVAGGIAPLSDQRKAELTLHSAEADVASETTLLAQDANALRLLVGADISPADLPATIADADMHLAEVAPGLSSDVLLRRPDVQQAEFALLAADAQIGAARAALFPRITLTALAGAASPLLSNLFGGGNVAWDGAASATFPIFAFGKNRAALKLARAQQAAALAGYRKAIESAFRDTADVLARRGTITAQVTAVVGARDAAADNYRLTDRRYRGGVGTWLDSLTAQQAFYAAEKTLVATRLARANNLVGLYRALGGDSPGQL